MFKRKQIKNWWSGFIKEIKTHTTIYILLATILIGAFFVRAYRANELLQFYYDQGRDALVIWRLWHEGKFFLIGPVTGLAGIFLGPLYYYFIAPIYLVGRGNPVYVSVFLALTSTLAVYMLYFLGKKMHSRAAGIIAATIGAFSYYLVLAGRWLSNPTLILLTSMILLWSLWEIAEQSRFKFKSKKMNVWWVAASLMIGISLHFESASAIFYIPLIFIFAVYMRKNLPNLKTTLISGFVFFLTLIPQILFNFRHDNILLNNFMKLFFQEKAFKGITRYILEVRANYFWSVFSTKLFPGWNAYAALFSILAVIVLIVARKSIKKHVFTLFAIFLLTPMVGYILFQGNFGNIYDYYLTGYYLPSVLLFAVAMGELVKRKMTIVVLVFFIAFFSLSGTLVKNLLTSKVGGRPISLEEQLLSVNWVFDDAADKVNFNIDVYVPPVIPHAYDYLFLWQATERCGDGLCGWVKDENIELLYILYEDDPPHPERLETWLSKYEDNTLIEQEEKYGAITVQRRRRI